MKYLLILFTILSINLYSQIHVDTFDVNKELPDWFIHKGDTVGLVFSIEQVQKMDSDLELLSWLEKKGFTCDSTIAAYIKVIDEYGKQVTIFKAQVFELENKISDKDSQILNLKKQIDNHKEEKNLYKSEIEKLNEIIQNDNKRIRNLKKQRNLSIGGGALLTTVAALITYFILNK